MFLVYWLHRLLLSVLLEYLLGDFLALSPIPFEADGVLFKGMLYFLLLKLDGVRSISILELLWKLDPFLLGVFLSTPQAFVL